MTPWFSLILRDLEIGGSFVGAVFSLATIFVLLKTPIPWDDWYGRRRFLAPLLLLLIGLWVGGFLVSVILRVAHGTT